MPGACIPWFCQASAPLYNWRMLACRILVIEDALSLQGHNVAATTQGLKRSSSLVMTCFPLRDYNILPKKELHLSPWVNVSMRGLYEIGLVSLLWALKRIGNHGIPNRNYLTRFLTPQGFRIGPLWLPNQGTEHPGAPIQFMAAAGCQLGIP